MQRDGSVHVFTFRNYSAESASHEVDAVTDEQGHVAFAAQTIKASLVRRIAMTLSAAQAGIEPSFGPHAHVRALTGDLRAIDVDPSTGVLVDWTGSPGHMVSRIKLSEPQVRQ